MFATGFFSGPAFGISFREVSELERVFKDRAVAGTFVLFDSTADTMFVWNEERAKQQFSPAATFRIAHALVALDVGAIKSIDEVIPYEGKQYRTFEQAHPYIYGRVGRANRWPRNFALRKAMRMTHTPTFRELARRIGTEQMRNGLTKLTYGNMTIGNGVDQFWRDGTLKISAVEQVEFLARLGRGRLPIPRGAQAQVKELTLKEKTDTYRLHSKSGLSIGTKPQVGWWVGWIERGDEISSFALNIDISDIGRSAEYAAIGRECLKTLGKL